VGRVLRGIRVEAMNLIRQTITWTAIPNGIKSDGKLKLSVLVSPRLESDEFIPPHTTPILKQFPDFLDWTSKKIDFSVVFQEGNSFRKLGAKMVNMAEKRPWSSIFNETTTVESYIPDKYSDRVIRSYPVSEVAQFLKQQYQQIAILSPTQFPSASQLMEGFSLNKIVFDWQLQNGRIRPAHLDDDLNHDLDETLKKHGTVPPTATGQEPNPTLDFFQVKRFHQPHSNVDKIATSAHKKAKWTQYQRAVIEKPHIDFHKMVSSLGQYPKLMRYFGLVIDLEIEVPTGVTLPDSSLVWVVPNWSPILPNTKNVSSKTNYMKGFVPKPGPTTSYINDAMLSLNDENLYSVIPVDVDGAAIKLMNFASNLLRSQSNSFKTTDTPNAFSVPSLRSGGISVAWKGLSQDLLNQFRKADSFNSSLNSNIILNAEDLVRGYRVDIFDVSSGKWQSLCRRRGEYNFINSGLQIIEEEDEGYVSTGMTESATGLVESPSVSSKPDLYLPESMFRWSGWSLCVSRPATRLNIKNAPEKYIPKADTEFKMVTKFNVVKNSLPRLRFGSKYKVRVRLVDLAGNSISWDDTNSSRASSVIQYSRFEPISAPAVILKKSLDHLPGESDEHLVIRAPNDSIFKDGDPTVETTERHIVPPAGSFSIAEAHRKFDDPNIPKNQFYNTITSKEGSFQKIQAEDRLVMPYLPDPISRGAVFLGMPYLEDPKPIKGLPGAPDNEETTYHSGPPKDIIDLSPVEKPAITLIKVDFGQTEDWPDLKPFILKVVGTLQGDPPKEPEFNFSTRVLTVSVPQAEIARVRLSSYLTESDLELMSIWNWIKESGISSEVIDKLRYYALQGRHWMLTPFRDITIVHAVQQPLGLPAFHNLHSTRKRGDTFATLIDDLKINRKSTGKIDMIAGWTDRIDDLSEPKYQDLERTDHAFDIQVRYPAPTDPDENILNIEHAHKFGDTKHRDVKYVVMATTRFKEYFPSKDSDPKEKWIRLSEPKTINILSSVRPDAPKVLYVVPIFDWNRNFSSAIIRSSRKGGLRIYMERPWYSSGDGERLGVVLLTPTAGATLPAICPDDLKPYITQWAGDPIWLSETAEFSPSIDDFILADKSESGLTLEELDKVPRGSYKISVAGHQVDFDTNRGLWYCDIEINTHGVYYPFIRLALARYQENSVTEVVDQNARDVKLSRVVLADFAQLVPDRAVSIVFNRSRTVLNVTITGQPGTSGNTFDIKLEKRNEQVGGDLGWDPWNATVNPNSNPPRGALWSGLITLPEPSINRSFRLVIREFESFQSQQSMTSRVVYAETLEL
jgi:hypothetical protein